MSVAGHHDLPKVKPQHLLDRMDERSANWLFAFVALALIGVVGFVAGLAADPVRAWTALVWNWAFFSGVSIAGAVVTAAAATAQGGWVRPLRRFAEGMTAFLPVSFVLMLILFFGLEHVYSWVNHPPAGKEAWLDPEFFMVRQIVVVGVLYGLAGALVYRSLRPDAGRFRHRVTGWRARLYERVTRGWEGLDIEVEQTRRIRSKLAPAMALLYAVLWTVWAWDWIMSVDPYWFSTLFGAWIFMTHFLAALGAIAVLACTFRTYRSFEDVITTRVLHDIGKMLFAFTVFWTYLFFAQYLVIWYGRLPEETGFVDLRVTGVYQPVATVVLLAVFLIPFVGLLGARPKRTPATLTAFATTSLIGIWLFHMLLVAPGVFPDFIAFGWIEIAVALGLFGVFALCYLAFMTAFPALAITAGVPLDEQAEEMAELQEPHEPRA
ncbi:MAG TPA: hypothetical protein VM778_13220 [Gemmatimonadota bacterium]|nr:hypothetical protein [Gemmatimonadota bacterium]